MISWRVKVFWLRMFDYVMHIPDRFIHLFKWLFWINLPRGRHRILRWMAGLIMLVVDISPIALIYETILDAVKWKTRPLTATEKEIVFFVFAKSIPDSLIGLDPSSIPARKGRTRAYVSFHTINFNGDIPDSMLVHEMVHIWQYKQYGAAYISESIWAQLWGGGYNYGGLEPLKMYSDGLQLKAFNFEQQADIIEDYFRWVNNIPLQWAANVPGVGDVLSKYSQELKTRG